MTRPQFGDLPGLWDCDGSLRDIYLHDTNLESWERFVAFGGSVRHVYSCNGISSPLPSAREIFAKDCAHLLSLFPGAGTAAINCHFFWEEEIELDIDPREVRGPQEHEQILDFIEALAQAVGQPALLTEENYAKDTQGVFLSYDPAHDHWTVHPPRPR